jgi:large subunit ribosomal protein L13
MWYLMDARDQVVGRLAATLSLILQGKSKPIYHPAVDVGDHVVLVNTRHVVFTGKKWKQKIYRHHTGYPGLKEITAERLHNKDPTMVIQKAVNGMLPKNNLRKKRMRRLHLFPDDVST